MICDLLLYQGASGSFILSQTLGRTSSALDLLCDGWFGDRWSSEIYGSIVDSLGRDPHAPMRCVCVLLTDIAWTLHASGDRVPTPQWREKVSRPITELS